MTFLHALSCSSRPLGSRNRIVPGIPRPLALEARFMFDGAAAAEAVDAVAEHSEDCDEGLQPLTSPRITQAYAVDTDETPGTRNQNSHAFTNDAITVKSIQVDTDPGDGFGNDILASITLVIDGKDTTYFGWISRQIKDGKETQGLYFWTDSSFTSEGEALDGYKDQRADPDNNQAFILALGTKWEGEARSFTEKSSSDIKTKDWETDACDEPDNRAPMASSDSASSDEDTPLSGNVLANDADPDGDALSVTGFRFIDPSSGSIVQSQPGASVAIGNAGDFSLNADGRYTFTPALHYNGTLPDITYTVSDPGNLSVSAILSLTINPVNDAPTPNDDRASINEDNALFGTVLSNDTDPDGDALNVISFSVDGAIYTAGSTATMEGVGTITIASTGDYVFAPALHYTGTVPSIQYTVVDSGNSSASANLQITLKPVNDAPIANDDSATGDEDGDPPVSGDVLSNDTDPDGDKPTVTGFSFIDPATNEPVVGQLEIPVDISNVGQFSLRSDGKYTFTPLPDYSGEVPVITYTVVDSGKLTASANLHLTINPVNDAPVARNDSQSENEDTEMTGNVLSNDDDPDGVPPQVTGFSFIDPGTEEPVQGQPGVPVDIGKSGTFTLNTDGSYTFTPRSDYNGSVPVITYTVTDAGNLKASADLSLTVKPVNDAPTSTDDTATTNESTSLVLSASDFGDFADVDGDGLQAVHITARPTTGTLQRYDDGNWRALFAAESVFSVNALTNGHLRFVPGTADTSLQFRVSDGTSLSAATYTLTLNVTRTVSPVPTPEPMPAPPMGPTPPGSPPAPAPAPSPDPLPSDPAPAVQAIVVPAPPSASARGLFLPPPSAQPIVLDVPGRLHTPQFFDSTLYPHRAGASMGATYLIEPSSGHSQGLERGLALWTTDDSYTNAPDNDWRAAVHPDIRSRLAVWRGIPDQRVDTDDVAYVSVPWDSFSHTHSDAQVTLDATLADGSPLPLWMNLDPRAGVFEMVPPPGLEAELAIRLIARDAEGREAATLFRIQVGERERAVSDGATPTGRTGLSEQLREATRQSAASRLALPPQYMTAPAPHFASHPS